jgi:hypothetical protein
MAEKPVRKFARGAGRVASLSDPGVLCGLPLTARYSVRFGISGLGRLFLSTGKTLRVCPELPEIIFDL